VNTAENTEMQLGKTNDVGTEIHARKVQLVTTKAEVCIILWHLYC
jgi:hypothetical protein